MALSQPCFWGCKYGACRDVLVFFSASRYCSVMISSLLRIALLDFSVFLFPLGRGAKERERARERERERGEEGKEEERERKGKREESKKNEERIERRKGREVGEKQGRKRERGKEGS